MPFTVFVGPNGQGKSLLFEALHRFFIDFNPLTSPASAGVNDTLWYNREATQPIYFELEFKLSEEDMRQLLPFGDRIFQSINKSRQTDSQIVKIKRSLTPQGTWNTEEIAWANIPLVESNSIITPGDFLAPFLAEGYFSRYRMYFFTQGHSKDNMGGDRILVDEETKRAFTSHPSIDELVRTGVITSSEETIGKNWEEWCKEKGLSVQTPITLAQLAEILPVTPETLQQVITALTTLRTKFKLIPASRDVKATLGQRSSLLEPALLQTITATAIDRQRPSELKWERYRKRVEGLLRKRLEPNPTQVLVKERDLGLLPAQIGGGEQALMGLVWDTMDEDKVLAIEEPENHLHPGLQRQLLIHFQELASQTQVLITTHSAVFASKPDVQGVYTVFKNEEGATLVEQVNETNIDRLIGELGIKVSDVFDYDSLVFVEGDDDVKILRALSKQFLKMHDFAVGFLDSEGWNNMAYYANARVLKSRRLKVEVFAVFDGDTESDEKHKKIKERLISELKIRDDHITTLKRSSIESYLLVPNAIRRAFPLIRLSEDEIASFIQKDESKKNKKEVLDQLLRRGEIGPYTGELGAQIAQVMLDSEIDTELKDVMKNVSQPVTSQAPQEKTTKTSKKNSDEHIKEVPLPPHS
jgi:hypothetical protein